MGRLSDQMLKQIPIALGNLNRLQRHAVFFQRHFHVLEGFFNPAVLWQQILTE